MPEVSIRAALGEAINSLATVESADLDAAVLLGSVLGRSRSWLAAHLEEPVSEAQRSEFQRLITQRVAKVPVAYLIGHKEFYGRDFLVGSDVLVPRPETEQLVELALAQLADAPQLVEVGTGSGCIAITIKLESPATTVAASDVSAAALAVATRNAKRLEAEISLSETDLCPPLAEPADTVVVANLPYVPSAEATVSELSAEPQLALDGGPDGFDVISRLLEQLKDRMPKALLLEIDPSHAKRLRERFSGYCEIVPDLAGRDRFAVITPH